MSAYIDTYRARFGVEPICNVLGVSASAYYHRKTGARSQRVIEDERLLVLIREEPARFSVYRSQVACRALPPTIYAVIVGAPVPGSRPRRQRPARSRRARSSQQAVNSWVIVLGCPPAPPVAAPATHDAPTTAVIPPTTAGAVLRQVSEADVDKIVSYLPRARSY